MTRRLLLFITACLILLDIDYVNSVTSNNLSMNIIHFYFIFQVN